MKEASEDTVEVSDNPNGYELANIATTLMLKNLQRLKGIDRFNFLRTIKNDASLLLDVEMGKALNSKLRTRGGS